MFCILEQYVPAQLSSGKGWYESEGSLPHKAVIRTELFGRKQCLKVRALSDPLPNSLTQLPSSAGLPIVSPDSCTHKSSRLVWLIT